MNPKALEETGAGYITPTVRCLGGKQLGCFPMHVQS
jgi:hypothetical protein